VDRVGLRCANEYPREDAAYFQDVASIKYLKP